MAWDALPIPSQLTRCSKEVQNKDTQGAAPCYVQYSSAPLLFPRLSSSSSRVSHYLTANIRTSQDYEVNVPPLRPTRMFAKDPNINVFAKEAPSQFEKEVTSSTEICIFSSLFSIPPI